jgi:GT2 family glycosyltransferase
MLCSIIIPAYNNWDLTKRCLESIERVLRESEIKNQTEILVVNNGSIDGTESGLNEMVSSGLSVQLCPIHLEKNLGFSKGCNIGAKQSKGEFLLFLNNDMVAYKNSIEILLKTIQERKTFGMVGARLIYANGTIQHAGMALDSDKVWRHLYRHEHGESPFVLKRRSFQCVTGACMVMRRSLFFEVGQFDEQYINGYEDVDLCHRVTALGYEIIYEPEALFVHYESVSEGRNQFGDQNRAKYLEKWGDKLKVDLDSHTIEYAKGQGQKLIAQADLEIQNLHSLRNGNANATSNAAVFETLSQVRGFVSSGLTLLNREKQWTLEKELQDLKNLHQMKIRKLDEEIQTLKLSSSYRIGMLILWPLRKIKSLWHSPQN